MCIYSFKWSEPIIPYVRYTRRTRYVKTEKGRRVRAYEAQQLAIKLAANLQAIKQGLREPLSGDIRLSGIFIRKHKAGDLNNLIKALEDALQGSFYVDDRQVKSYGK